MVLGEGSFEEFGSEEMKFVMSVSSSKHDHVKMSVSNIPKVEFSLAKDVDGYAVALANNVVMTEAALAELEQWLV